MKLFFAGVIFLQAWVVPSAAQTLRPVDARSMVKFEIRNVGLFVTGRLADIQGLVEFDVHELPSSTIDLTVSAKSISTGIALRDRHLQNEDYLDAKRFPLLKFKSSRIEKSGGQYRVAGKLTIKGIEMETSIPCSVTQLPDGLEFAGTFTVNRHDFDVGGGAFTIGDSVAVSFRIVVQ